MGSVLRPKMQGPKGDGGPNATLMTVDVVGSLLRSLSQSLSSFTEVGPPEALPHHHRLFDTLAPLTKHPGSWVLGKQASHD